MQDFPRLITELPTIEIGFLTNCLNYVEIWTTGKDEILNLYDFQGEQLNNREQAKVYNNVPHLGHKAVDIFEALEHK